jgi:hypothetical protein
LLAFLIPLNPKYIISIPAIRSVTANIITNRTKPSVIGLAIIVIDIATLSAPTPIINPFENIGISLEIPCTILAIPPIIKAAAPRITKDTDVTIGNCIRKIEMPITTAPSTISIMRVFLDETGDNPTAILSIPTTSNIIDIKRIRVNKAIPGNMTKNNRITTESKTAMEPKTICNIRSQGGDLIVCTWRTQLPVIYIDDDTYVYSFGIP